MKEHPPVAALLARDLAAYGARRCFGLLGTANFKISHALVNEGVQLISARHEVNAACMADAYSKATQELTLVSVHSGPGLTNALTGIGEAAKSRTPLLVLAGDVSTGALKSNFHIEQAEMVRAVGAISERIHTPATAREDALRAVVKSLRDRQTVVLSLPTDVQDAPYPGLTTPLALPPAPGPLHPDPESVFRLAKMLAGAKRPLILAGRGAVIAGAEATLTSLAERSGALLATSICGHGLFAGNLWSVGISGGFASPAADELIRESDLIVAFGASLNHWTTKRGKLIAPGAVVAQVDVEAAKLGYQTPIQHAVLADARVAAEAILAELDKRAIHPRMGWRSEETRKRIDRGDNHNAPYQDTSSADFIDPRTLSKAVELHPAEGSRRRVGLWPFLRLGAPISARAERKSFMPQPFLPVGRSWSRLCDRFGNCESRGFGRARRRRRRFPDVAHRSRDCCPPEVENVHPHLQRQLLRGGGAPLPTPWPFHRHRAVSRHRLRRHRAWPRRACVHRQDSRRSRTSAGLGEQGRPGGIRNRCQDKPRPGSRLARRAFPVIAALSSVPHSRPDCLLLAQGCHLSVMRLSGSLPDVLRTICSRSVLSSPEAALDPKPNRAPSEHVASEAGRLHWRAFRLAG